MKALICVLPSTEIEMPLLRIQYNALETKYEYHRSVRNFERGVAVI